jgi:hypothetical protein
MKTKPKKTPLPVLPDYSCELLGPKGELYGLIFGDTEEQSRQRTKSLMRASNDYAALVTMLHKLVQCGLKGKVPSTRLLNQADDLFFEVVEGGR